ncbi:MAG TPA: protein kinase, partial [Polyangium sp.]|nr:protein kinase [Polyangium sp.]
MRGGEVLADRFEVEHLAGSGGMGDVYRARDLQTGQPVAIKVLTGQRAGDMARFDREVRILSSITHPRIVHYVTHGVLPSKDPYCVMEWLEGEDLSQRILRGPLPVADAVTIGIHAAEGLTVLHERGIMHRDIKPSNLYLVNRNIDEVKLLDLGIARSESSAKLTGTGMLLGTVAYMAPEQANGSATIDARTDIFSLGCVLFECLTGEVAFDGSNVMAILTKILFEDTPRLRQNTPHLPQALCALVERMLSNNPDERPNSALAVAQALHDLGSFSGTPWEQTLEVVGTYSITHSEQRAVALIFIGGRGNLANDEQLAFEATRHGGRFERLFDGSAAVMLVGPQVPTDLAAQAARCALALKRHTGRRHMALAMDRSEGRGPRTVGLAIDRAAKLVERENCTPATEEHVMLDNATVGLLDARFDVLEDSGIFVLRAERDIVEVRTLMGKPTPCLGRDRELRMLEEAYDDCVNDSTVRVILLTGAAGMGKSRIANELVHRIRSRDEAPSIWTARGELLGAGSALSMLAELVRRVCGIRTGESLEVRRNKLSVRVQLNVPARDQKRVTEFLGEIVGAHFSSDVSPALRAARKDPQLMGDQIRAAFEDFLRAECAAGPVFILLEDLHWGDGATIRILGTALAAVAEKSLFLLALGRPEVEDVFPRLWAERGLETRRLQQLAKRASEQLVRHVLGMNADSQTV